MSRLAIERHQDQPLEAIRRGTHGKCLASILKSADNLLIPNGPNFPGFSELALI
jgi:hypothetical protein